MIVSSKMKSLSIRVLLPCCAMVLTGFAAAVAAQQPPGFPPTSQPATQPDDTPGLPKLPDLPGIPTLSDLFIKKVEKAHGAAAWRSKDAIRADLEIEFGGQEMLKGTMTYEIGRGRVRIEMADETVLVFDGQRAWVSPASSDVQGARFHLLTWPYFLAAPFKLGDEGVNLQPTGLKPLGKKLGDSARITFDADVGDTPDDWYVVFAHGATDQLMGLAYIVTFGTPTAEAETQPHAIVYDGYINVDGVSISTMWSFHNWSERGGLENQSLGKGRLSNVEFITPEQGVFDRPTGAKEDVLPKS